MGAADPHVIVAALLVGASMVAIIVGVVATLLGGGRRG